MSPKEYELKQLLLLAKAAVAEAETALNRALAQLPAADEGDDDDDHEADGDETSLGGVAAALAAAVEALKVSQPRPATVLPIFPMQASREGMVLFPSDPRELKRLLREFDPSWREQNEGA